MTPTEAPRNVAVVHDWLVDFAGAERVLEQILGLFPGATLYTLIDRMPAADRVRLPAARTVTSFLNRLPRVERYFTRTLPLMPLAVQQFDLNGHDLIISSSHCVAKGVVVPPDALHLSYCHSPMRYVWDQQATTLRTEGLAGGLSGALARVLLHRLRQWDAVSHQGVERIAANSQFVRERIRRAWRRESDVIHPPVSLPVSPDAGVARDPQHFVTVGRLMGYKNVALMLEAFRLTPELRLTVVGTGPLQAALARHAPPNVQVAGFLPGPEVSALLSRAGAFVFAAVEDFGIAPLDALAHGTPVVALGRGGVLDYLRHGDNAWLFDEATPAALAAALRDSRRAWPVDVAERCRSSALPFAPECFRAAFSGWVSAAWQEWQGLRPGSQARPASPAA
jgi:glycosyltransferase involved in cell wall biosynthesis